MTNAYLSVCDHLKRLIFCDSERDARLLLGCETCITVSRAYPATEDDLRLFSPGEKRSTKRVKSKKLNQSDWVGVDQVTVPKPKRRTTRRAV